MPAAIILDIVIAVLLVITIFYCWHLNRRLAALRKGREELAKLINSLTESMTKAETGINQLKSAAKEAGDDLRKEVSTARTLRDELALITESGNNLANRLENGVMNNGRSREDGSVDLDAVRAARAERRGRAASAQHTAETPTQSGKTAPRQAAENDDGGGTSRAELLDQLKQAR